VRLISPKALGVFLVAMATMSGSTVLRAAEPDGPDALIGAKEALIITVATRASDRFAQTASRAEQKGILDYYAGPDAKPLWVDENGLNARAKAVMEEIGKADDYGLRASDYKLPKADGLSGADTQALADAEITLSLAALRYARDARGGRIEPVRIDPNLDPTLALPDPLQMMESLAIRSDAAAYLRSFQPSQPQFEALRKALLAARGGKPGDDIVTIPDGPTLKLGVQDEQVELLRTRLNIEAPASGNAKRFDESVEEAVKRFQMTHGAAPDGVVGPGTRRLLNRQGQSASNPTRVKQILVNMERWRWLPSDLGSFYVAANIPEFMVKVVDDGKPVFTTRIVVGKPDKQTPVFSNEMQEIVFNPYWNVPNSIKTEELMPAIRGGGDWFFGGGGGWDTTVFERNGLRVAIGNREVDPSTLDWSRIDIRSLNIYQPPGPTNVLGTVKFLFPNKHDVYMHDTTQKNLFAQTVRAESHGCMRVQNPDQFAVTLLKHVQGWSASQVSSAIASGEDEHVALKQKIPVYITYFTLWVNADGSISTFRDIYGHDSRMAAALFGEPLPMAYEPPQMVEDYAVNQPPPRAYQQRRRRGGRPINTIADSISAFINN
jgi:murein L,D-transpeptidase YcbB/YkuD